MSNAPLIVLKLGGSILAGESDLALATHEIYRWVRQGYQVIAVVSALHGTTDRLLARTQRYGDQPNESAVATLIATGELTSASLLTLHLDRAGIPAHLLDAAAINLRSTGPRLDSTLSNVDTSAITRALDQNPVLIIPGFIARNDQNETTLLGRGGSDLTALYLAHKLGARCRLIKDVPGVYNADPNEKGSNARRYQQITWEELVQVGGKIVQPKTATYARDNQVKLEVAALLSEDATQVGALASRFFSPHSQLPTPNSPLRISILGHGTVGGGVARAIRRQPERFELISIAVRTPEKHTTIPKHYLTTDALAAATGPADVIIEAIGGLEPPYTLIKAALQAGKHVITANKAVIAKYGRELEHLAAVSGAKLSYSAAVGGSVPVIETVRNASPISTIRAVVNGTSNFILDKTAEGATFTDAISEAQLRGLAEADPSRDLDGRDAEDKLRILAREAWNADLISVRRIALTADIAALKFKSGTTLRQVATLFQTPEGVQITVAPEPVLSSHTLAQARREGNAIEINHEDGSQTLLKGKGAGRWPTTEAVIADLIDLHHLGRNENARPEDRAFIDQEIEAAA